MEADRHQTTIRAPRGWLRDLDMWAQAHGTSRHSAILVLTSLAMKHLDTSKVSPEDVQLLIDAIVGS